MRLAHQGLLTVKLESLRNGKARNPSAKFMEEEIPRNFASRQYMAVLWRMSTGWSMRHKKVVWA
jgi:hypothetical protein